MTSTAALYRDTVSVAYVILVIGLFFTVTNHVYVSAVPSLFFLITLVPMFVIRPVSTISRITLYTLLFYLVSILSVLLYRPASLVDFNFYRYDANFIISYAPFLYLPFLCHRQDINQLFRVFIYSAVAINIPAYIYFFFIWNPYYMTLYSATNAAGGFYSIICALLIALLVNDRKWIHAAALLFMFILLLETTSRGSLLGLTGGFFIWWLWRKGLRYAGIMVIGSIILVQVVLIANFYSYYKVDTTTDEYARMSDGEYFNTKQTNIYQRLLREWPRGVDLFLRSPLVGYGFGSLNDRPYHDKGLVPGVIERNDSNNVIFNAAHAHHSYLHILGEQGLLGLLLIIGIWSTIYRFLVRTNGIPWIRDGLIISFWSIILASFTEHRITAPAMILPFSMMFLLYYGYCMGISRSSDTRDKLAGNTPQGSNAQPDE
jgi:O-antigen ligase